MKIFSLSYLLQNNKLFLMDIESTIGSINNVVGFTADSQRLIYLKNSEMIHIVPPLHRTTINFMGMSSRNNYLATKKYKDKFYALDRYNTITTWDAVNGKIMT
jgi:folate-dependent tRNA-U54 methylase TrmFO/GidA